MTEDIETLKKFVLLANAQFDILRQILDEHQRKLDILTQRMDVQAEMLKNIKARIDILAGGNN
jgi:hypothetical protein